MEIVKPEEHVYIRVDVEDVDEYAYYLTIDNPPEGVKAVPILFYNSEDVLVGRGVRRLDIEE